MIFILNDFLNTSRIGSELTEFKEVFSSWILQHKPYLPQSTHIKF